MKLKKLVDEAVREMEDDKKGIAKEIIKTRITEIQKAEKILAKLRREYNYLLDKSISEIVDEIENDNIYF